MSFDVERGLISKILELKDLSGLDDNNITIDFFTGNNKNAMQFITKTFKSTGQVPTIRAFKREFPKYKLDTYTNDEGETVIGTEENLKYWCCEVRKKVKHNSIVNSIEEAATLLQDFNTDEAYSHIKKTISFIETEVVETTDVDITKDTDKRKEAYLKRKENRGIRGITTGLRRFDAVTKGIEEKTLTTVIANTGVGKTWLEILFGARFQLSSYSVLQAVTEMSEEIMRDRYEAMLFSLCYGKPFRYNDFKSGQLDPETEKLFFQFLDEDLPRLEPLNIVTATGVMKLSSDIEKYNPDVVLIDSAYLMQDDQGAKDDWLRVAHITRDLKVLAKTSGKPIIINTQADKNTSKKTGPELDSIMYTQAVGQDSDTVLALFRDEMMINDKEMGLKLLKQREGELAKFQLNWNFDIMDFSEIYTTYAKSSDENSSEDNTVDLEE